MLVVPTIEQLDRLGTAWAEAQRTFDPQRAGGASCARLADLALATAATARRLQRMQSAEQVLAQTLARLKAACAHAPTELPRHLAFARVLEGAAAHEQRDARAAFDALRAAAAVLAPFASRMGDANDPIARLAVSSALLRPLAAAARMLDDSALRRQTWQRCWDAARTWAEASRGAPDHSQAVECAVLLAFDLATDELEESAGACLERCEELRPHLESLEAARKGDAASLLHWSAFHRLWADAWLRLGDLTEARRALDECERALARLDALKDGDAHAVRLQRAALERDRARIASRIPRANAAATGP